MDDLDITIDKLMDYAYEKYEIIPDFIIKSLIFTGVFTWVYELQVYIN